MLYLTIKYLVFEIKNLIDNNEHVLIL